MAEGWLRQMAGDQFYVTSAGTRPVGVNSRAVQVMGEMGIDLSRHRSKHINEFAEQRFDHVIMVCDHAKESCPIFPGAKSVLHWSFDDPAHAEGSDEERLTIFRRVRDQIGDRIKQFLVEIK